MQYTADRKEHAATATGIKLNKQFNLMGLLHVMHTYMHGSYVAIIYSRSIRALKEKKVETV